MGHNDVDKIAGDMHQAPVGADGKQDFSQVYQELSALKNSESKTQYDQDMAELTKKMHDQGILPNVSIADVNAQGLQFVDQNGATLTKDASSIDNKLGQLNQAGFDIDDPNQMFGQAMGFLSKNPDGSIDMDIDKAEEAVKKGFDFIGSLFGGLVEGLADSKSTEQPTEEEA